MQLCEITVQYGFMGSSGQEKITGSHKAASLLRFNWDDDINVCESFLVMHLSSGNAVKGIQRVSKGGITGTLADIRLIFGVALKALSTGIILAHNHPSGFVKPSSPDLALTKKIKEAGQLLDVKVMDHIILNPEGEYFSFADEGMM